jgi:GLPGLI family protein
MTKIIQYLTIAIILFAINLINAQDFQGKAYYQTKRSFTMSMDSTQVPNGQQEAIQAMIRKQFEKTYILTFNKTESTYKEEEKLDAPAPNSSGIQIKIGGIGGVLYKNIKEADFADAQDMFGKKFLIQDKLRQIDWQTQKETKMIGKYLCLKATFTEMIDDFSLDGTKSEKQKERIITAWYTPEIPISNGPKDYQGLPGLILELHEEKMHYVCNKIVMNPKEKIEIKAPTKGKKVNEEEFEKIMDKKQKEMMENFNNGRKKGDGGNTVRFTIGG